MGEGRPTSPPGLGRALYELGWRQGTVFSAPSIGSTYFAMRDGKARSVETEPESERFFVLVSQDCDLTADKEALVEALECCAAEGYGVKSNNVREFVVQDYPELVALAARRVLLEKAVLAECEPLGQVTRKVDFARWLARRFDRPAVPDPVVQLFSGPTNDLIRKFFKGRAIDAGLFSGAVREIRVNLPASVDPPFELHLIFLLNDRVSGDQLDILEAVRDEILGLFKADDPQIQLDREIRFLSEEEMTVAEYFASVPLWFEDLTYRGGQVVGSTPFGTG